MLQLNITALMGSENQAKNLLALIDRGLDELDILDKRLSNYDEMLLVSFFEVPLYITILIVFTCSIH